MHSSITSNNGGYSRISGELSHNSHCRASDKVTKVIVRLRMRRGVQVCSVTGIFECLYGASWTRGARTLR